MEKTNVFRKKSMERHFAVSSMGPAQMALRGFSRKSRRKKLIAIDKKPHINMVLSSHRIEIFFVTFISQKKSNVENGIPMIPKIRSGSIIDGPKKFARQ